EYGKKINDIAKGQAATKYGPGFTQVQLNQERKAAVRRLYRRRSVRDVMSEVEDEAKERFAEHQLKIETVQIIQDELNDLSGANRPIELQLFGPDYRVLRHQAKEIGDKLEDKGKGRGLRDVNSHVLAGNPDLKIRIDGARAGRVGLTAQEV